MNITINPYLITVLATTLILPLTFAAGASRYTPSAPYLDRLETWFLVYAVGLRLLVAGLRQLIDPMFTLQKIFLIDDARSAKIVQELGIHNIALGSAALACVISQSSTLTIELMAGLFFGLAGILHLSRPNRSFNQTVAMISDIVIALTLLFFAIRHVA